MNDVLAGLRTRLEGVLAVADLPALRAAMGYRVAQQQQWAARLQKLRADPLLGLNSSDFDLRYSAHEFLLALLQATGLPAEPDIDTLRQRLVTRQQAYRPWLFADTGFRRSTEPLFALSLCEGQRRIRLPLDCVEWPQAEQVKQAVQLAQQHYLRCDGQLPIWGPIGHYLLHISPSSCLRIAPNGAVSADPATAPPPAQLKLGQSKLDSSELQLGLPDADDASVTRH